MEPNLSLAQGILGEDCSDYEVIEFDDRRIKKNSQSKKMTSSVISIPRMNRYETNKSAKVGTEIKCPTCGKKFKKKSYQQAFCCTSCKDRYWNKIRKDNGYFKQYNINHPERLERIGIDPYHDPVECLGEEDEAFSHISLVKDDSFDDVFSDYDY